jgi:hypothetical protein
MDKSSLKTLHKHSAFIAVGFFFFMLSGIALSADQDPQQQRMEHDQRTDTQKQSNGKKSRLLYKVSVLRSRDIKNEKGEELGEITDLVIGKSGQIKYAVLSHGGTLGMEEKMTAVTWDKLQISEKGKYYTLNVSKKQLADAPTFNKENWPSNAQWPVGLAHP